MEDSLPTTIPQYQKSSLPSIPYYSKLEAKFWDSENIIMRQYKKIKDRTKDNTSLAHVEKSKDILTSPEMKSEYNSNLFYHYISSQPSTIIQLIELTSNVVYPFYLFILDSCNYSYLILDYLTFQLKFLDAKLEVAQSIEVMTITDINVNDGVITLKTSSVKNNVHHFQPQNSLQINLIYVLIIFMEKAFEVQKNKAKIVMQEVNQHFEYKIFKTISKETINIEERFDINKLSMLLSDVYIPKGIQFASYIYLDKPKKPNEYDKFITMGSSYIILFNDESMSKVLMYIPIFSTNIIIECSNSHNLNVIIKTDKDTINMYFPTKDVYREFKRLIMRYSEGVLESQITLDVLEKICYYDKDNRLSEDMVTNSIPYQKAQQHIDEILNRIQQLEKRKEVISQMKNIIIE